MKKNRGYFLLLIVLAVAVYFFVFKNKMTTLNGKDDAFAVKDTANIYKIFMADMSGRNVTLQRKGAHWIINNAYPVRSDEIQVLLSTIKQVAVKYPLNQASRDVEMKEMAGTATKIEIYDKDNSLLKSYYVGGADLLRTGTYMKMPGSDKIYATYIPGFYGYLSTRYSLDTATWRDRTIFNFTIPQISSITVNYTDNRKDSSFEISVISPDSFILKPLNRKTVNVPAIKEKLFLYLLAYKQINAEAYKNDEPRKDSVLQTTPFCTITLVDNAGIPHIVKCYHKKIIEQTMAQFDRNGKPLLYDIDHYYASINNGKDFVIIQQFHFGKLFKTYDYFFTPISPSPQTN
jgi:hypothetical protein